MAALGWCAAGRALRDGAAGVLLMVSGASMDLTEADRKILTGVGRNKSTDRVESIKKISPSFWGSPEIKSRRVLRTEPIFLPSWTASPIGSTRWTPPSATPASEEEGRGPGARMAGP